MSENPGIVIQEAIEALENGQYNSERAVAKAYNIRSTLCRRLMGVNNRRESHQHQQRSAPRQEEFIMEWIMNQHCVGLPPSHRRTRETATEILRLNGDPDSLGKDWVTSLRNQDLRGNADPSLWD